MGSTTSPPALWDSFKAVFFTAFALIFTADQILDHLILLGAGPPEFAEHCFASAT